MMKPRFRKPFAIVLALILTLSAGSLFGTPSDVYANEPMTATLSDVFNLRSTPSTALAPIASLPSGQSVTILDTVIGQNVADLGYFWYYINAVVGGTPVTGYIIRNDDVHLLDNTFEKQLSAFPASYHAGLAALHAAHPSWTFTALKVGYDWNHVLDSQEGKNALWYSYPISQRALDTEKVNGYGPSYNLLDDTYNFKDGSQFYFASRQTIAYYLDPRNFLNEQNIFMFENLGYRSDQTAGAVNAILSGTFMDIAHNPVVNYVDTAGQPQTTGKNYPQIILEAAAYSKASAYFIAARMRMEIGVNPSNSVTGTFIFTNPEGVTTNFTGLYNYFNVYASDSPIPGQNIANGLTYARDGELNNPTNRTNFVLPWTSPERSISGGAFYIAQNYIRAGQDTLYLQKWSVNPTSNKFCWHQYMSSVHAPKGESVSVYNSYNSLGILDSSFEFIIPVYENMPASAAQASTETNSANNLLTSLSLSGGALSPGFSYDNNGTYTAYVDGSYANVTLTGRKASTSSAVSIGATLQVSGAAGVRDFTFSIPLAVGENVIPLTITAANGAANTYSIRIIRGIPAELDTPDLTSLGIVGASLTPAFNAASTGPYRVNIPFDIYQLTITAAQKSYLASVSGTGVVYPNFGVNTFPVVVTSPTNVQKTYLVEVTRVVPPEKDNTNLTGLSVDGVTFDRPFSNSDTGVYTATVDSSVATTTIRAAAQSEATTITGTGTKTLNFGDNEINISIRSFSGAVKVVTLRINRTQPVLNRGGLIISPSNILTGIQPGTTIQQIIDTVKAPGSETQVYRADGTRLGPGDLVGTGCLVRVVTGGTVLDDDIVVVYGDLNGDGRINAVDLTMMRRNILGTYAMAPVNCNGADINNDDKINAVDLVMARRFILGTFHIDQNR